MSRARQGKIARLSRALRDQVNRRLLDGETAEEILSWLNPREDVRAVLVRHFDGVPISPQNLSEWRAGGYAAWLREREREESIRELSAYAQRLAKASGGSLSEGAAAIAGGEILKVLELVSDGQETGVDLLDLVEALERLHGMDINRGKLDLAEAKERREGERLQLDQAKFQRETAILFLKWFEDERTKQIAESGADRDTKVGELIQLWFGEMPDNIGPPELSP